VVSISLMARPFLPESAVTWLVGSEPKRVLVVGAAGPYATAIREQGHAVLVLDRDPELLGRLIGTRPDLGGVVAQAESMPFDAQQFDRVVCPQNLHTFAPGLVLAEIGRVLAPGGRLCLTYLTRDDSVPWVKRLVGAVRTYLPTAMTGAYGEESVRLVEECDYFPVVETHTNRVWIPCSRRNLVDMALSAGADSLDDASRTGLANAVGAVYDASARPPEPLQLPYRLSCWRATVDHSELSRPLPETDDALHISLSAPTN
jgi:SAM-dependent methyltransferase